MQLRNFEQRFCGSKAVNCSVGRLTNLNPPTEQQELPNKVIWGKKRGKMIKEPKTRTARKGVKLLLLLLLLAWPVS